MSKSVYLYFFLFSLVIFSTFIFLFLFKFKIQFITAYLLAINLTTFFLYAYDKLVSLFSLLRVPEFILHLLSALGGTPMAYLAQKLTSHKKNKAIFQSTFKKIFLVQLFVLFMVGAAILYMA